MKLTKRQVKILEMLSQDGGHIVFVYRLRGIYVFGGDENMKIKQKTLDILTAAGLVKPWANMTFVISKKGQKYLESLK